MVLVYPFVSEDYPGVLLPLFVLLLVLYYAEGLFA